VNFRYPNITGMTSAEQIAQLRSYLYSLVEQLNMQDVGSVQPVAQHSQEQKAGSRAESVPAPKSTFNQIKDLIIKSADIVNAYYAQMSLRLEGQYVAQSDYGTYTAATTAAISLNSDRIDQNYTSVQKISGELEAFMEATAYVRQGQLFVVGEENLETELGQELQEGTPVYGVEVGQTVGDSFKKFARFTSYGMTLYDNNGNLSAYITDSRLNIPNAVIKNSLTRGGFKETISADGGSVERWVG